MRRRAGRLRPGDLVEVRPPDEILRTLDGDGAMDHVPFMPEMVALCGQRFRVARRVVKTCFSGVGSYAAMRRFRNDDVLVLEAPRCDGEAHDGCQKGCVLLWRETWLRRAAVDDAPTTIPAEARERLRARLKTRTGRDTYFCQASEILKATTHLSRRDQLRLSVAEIRAGNCGVLQMAARLATWFYWKVRRKLVGEYAAGPGTVKSLDPLKLLAGERVRVKPMDAIRQTMDATGHNRGLYFSPDLRLACGREYRVRDRLDRIIADGTGEMKRLRNTVSLDGSVCACPYINVGGCSRAELIYWREDWLLRSE
jgi:hypothetical protein